MSHQDLDVAGDSLVSRLEKKNHFTTCSCFSGEPIPRIQYTKEEEATWQAVFNTVLDLMPKHFCEEYQRVFHLLQKEGIFRPDRIPQLEDMSEFLKSMHEFQIKSY